MKVVYYFNNNKRSDTLMNATLKGLSRIGVEAFSKYQGSYEEPEADVAIFYGLASNLNRIRLDYMKQGKTAILFDLGYWGRHDGGRLQGYHRIAINGLHGIPFFNDIVAAKDRLHRFNLNLSPFKGTGDHILMCGQSSKAAGIYDLEPEEWEKNTVAEIRKHTDREIWYYPKGSWDGKGPIEGTTYWEHDLYSASKKARIVVGHHSNSCLHALEMGKPIYLDDGIAKPFSIEDLSCIEDYMLPDKGTRNEFMRKVAYCQWKVREVASGELFRFLNKHGIFE